MDPQVSIFISRDLDSRITAREVAAVTEWLQSGKALHAMRDHPWCIAVLMAGAWGARTTGEELREKWIQTWQNILKDPVSRASRKKKGPDQTVQRRWVWPWGKFMMMEHDSYT